MSLLVARGAACRNGSAREAVACPLRADMRVLAAMVRLRAASGAAVAALRRCGLVWLFLVAIAPAVLLCGWINRYGVNVPFGDEWALVPLFEKWRDGQLTFRDLYQQHNEHRIVVPKLIYFAFAQLTGWNLRTEMFFSVALCAGTSAGIFALLQRTLGGTPRQLLLLWAAANLLIFSPAQAQNWVWGFQLQMFLPTLCFVITLVILVSELRWWPKFAASVFLITVATFSFGSALLLWPIVGLFLALRGEGKWRVAAWLVAGAAVLGLYFVDYYRVARPQPATGNGLDYVGYFLVFLGGALARGRDGQLLYGAAVTGAVAFVFYAAVGVHFLRTRGDALRNAAPWLAVGLYAIGRAALAAYSRVNWGPKQAMDSRYVTSSAALYLALIVLVAMAARYLDHGSGQLARGVAAAKTATITAILVLTLAAFPAGLEDMATLHREQVAGLGALEFSQAIETSDALRRDLRMIPGFAPAPREHVKTLDRLQLLGYAPRSSAVLAEGQNRPASTSSKFGRVDGFKQVDAQNFEISGWAVLPRLERPAPVVALAYREGDRWVAFTLSDVWEWRDDVVARLHSRAYQASGWRKTFSRESLPAGADAVSAWAVDPLADEAHKLRGEHPLPKF